MRWQSFDSLRCRLLPVTRLTHQATLTASAKSVETLGHDLMSNSPFVLKAGKGRMICSRRSKAARAAVAVLPTGRNAHLREGLAGALCGGSRSRHTGSFLRWLLCCSLSRSRRCRRHDRFGVVLHGRLPWNRNLSRSHCRHDCMDRNHGTPKRKNGQDGTGSDHIRHGCCRGLISSNGSRVDQREARA